MIGACSRLCAIDSRVALGLAELPLKTTLGLSLPKPAAVGGHSNGTRILSAVGLKVVEAIEPDGNCGHRAVAFQLFGDQKRYSEIRSSVPGLLKARPELIDAWAAPFASELRLKKQRREVLGKTWTRCLAEIAKDRTYITYVELLVLRQYHNFPLVVLSVHKGHIEVHCGRRYRRHRDQRAKSVVHAAGETT